MTTLAQLAEQHRDHSLFSPSGAARWTACPGSLVANAMAPDSTSFEAAEGTVAHAMADEWLRTGKRPPLQTVIEDGYEIRVDDDMLAYVEQYVEWVLEDALGEVYYERKVDFSAYMPITGQTGTLDHASVTFGRARIKDLKYGRGVRVDVRDENGKLNPQLGTYLLALFDELDWYYHFEDMEVGIGQPRLDHWPTTKVTRAELLEFADWIRERAIDAWRIDAPRSPGEKQCQFCAKIVKASCPAYLAWFGALRDADGDVFDMPALQATAARADDLLDPEPAIVFPELSVEAACRIIGMRGAVSKWFDAMEDRVFSAALARNAPGWKVVDKLGDRSWEDEEKAKARMVEVGIPLDETENRKLKSPNQAEDLLHEKTKMGKKKARDLFDSLTVRPAGRALVKSSDKREPVPDDGSVFD